MKKIRYKKHLFAVVPLWLSTILTKANAPLKIVTSYSELSAITSPIDVCFYHLYQLRAKHYVGKTFDDMDNLAFTQSNLEWLEANASALQRAQIEFDALWTKHSNDIMEESVPAIVRKYNYVPRSVEGDTLILLADESSPYTSARSFYTACITELNKQMLYDRYKTLSVFKQYCLS